MNGPQHYRAAEFRINAAKSAESDEIEQIHLAYAQAHATLALVAATFDTALGPEDGQGIGDRSAWMAATSG